jgi:hypothetical protein
LDFKSGEDWMRSHQIDKLFLAWRVPVFFAVLMLLSCSLFDEGTGGEVTVVALSSKLIIWNHTSDAVYYVVFPRDLLPLIDWMPCSDPVTCTNKIQPGNRITVKYDEFMPEQKDDEAVVYWWHLARRMDGGIEQYAPDELRSIVVKL